MRRYCQAGKEGIRIMDEKKGVPKMGTFVEAWNETAKEDRRRDTHQKCPYFQRLKEERGNVKTDTKRNCKRDCKNDAV